MRRRLPRLGMGPVLIACLIVVLGTTMIPAFAAGTANQAETTEQDANQTTNCCCGTGGDSDVVDIDGNNNTVKIVIGGGSGDLSDVAGSNAGSTTGAAGGTDDNGGGETTGTGNDNAGGVTGGGGGNAESTDGGTAAAGGGGGAASVDVNVENGDVRVNGEDVANEENDGMSNEQAERTVAQIVNNVDGDTTVDNDDITRVVNENNINDGNVSGINVTALAVAINAANDNGDDNTETPPGDNQSGGNNAETGDNSQTASDIDNSTVLQFLLDQDFIDQSELTAAIENNSIDNSTILANIVNGDQTINQNSRYVDNSVDIDNSTTITQVIQNSTVVTNSTVVSNSTVVENSTINNGGNQTGGNQTGNGTGGGMAAPDISVTKNADTDEADVSLLGGGDVLQADDPTTFTVTVTNEGNATANDVVVNDDDTIADIDDLNSTTAFVVTDSDTSQGDFSAVTGDFDAGTLAPGDSATLTFDALAVSTDVSLLDGSLAELDATNDAQLVDDSVPTDSNADNDMGSATVTLVTALDLGDSTSVESVNATGGNATNTTANATAN